jgi:multiple sugar transport system permease protein
VALTSSLAFTKSDVRAVPVAAITELIRGEVFYAGGLMAAAVLGCIPVAVISSFFVDYCLAGLKQGVKS